MTNRIAKIGDEIILKSDVEKFASSNNLKYEEAKKLLIDKAILYTGAKMYVPEPSEEEIASAFRQIKADYAFKKGKDVKNITDEEVVTVLHYNKTSLKSFMTDLKKQVWINKYLESVYRQKVFTSYFPTDEEIKKYIKDNPDQFMQGEGCYLSMIYFSFYDENGRLKPESEINKINSMAEECLNKLKKGAKFEDMVEEYSSDLITKNATPKGRAGEILFDDPRVMLKFTQEILKDLKKANKGILLKIFSTYNGLYIFKIDEKIAPEKIIDKAAEIKAKDFIQKNHRMAQEKKVMEALLEELKKKITYIIYADK
jgi:hypothetical protein